MFFTVSDQITKTPVQFYLEHTQIRVQPEEPLPLSLFIALYADLPTSAHCHIKIQTTPCSQL